MRKPLCLLVWCAFFLLSSFPSFGMDEITDFDLEQIRGQAGVSIGFGGTARTNVSFNSLSWGDPDGFGSASGAGWVILSGTVDIEHRIDSGGTVFVEVSSTGAAPFLAWPFNVVIPANTSFVMIKPPSSTVAVNTFADPMTIGLGDTAGSIDGTLGVLVLPTFTGATATNIMTAIFIYPH